MYYASQHFYIQIQILCSDFPLLLYNWVIRFSIKMLNRTLQLNSKSITFCLNMFIMFFFSILDKNISSNKRLIKRIRYSFYSNSLKSFFKAMNSIKWIKFILLHFEKYTLIQNGYIFTTLWNEYPYIILRVFKFLNLVWSWLIITINQ